jgi:hypothetical protein
MCCMEGGAKNPCLLPVKDTEAADRVHRLVEESLRA